MTRHTLVVAIGIVGAVSASSAASSQDRDRRLDVGAMSPDRGAVGTTVTVAGTFPTDTVVSIGNERVTPTFDRRGTLRFVVPELAPGAHRVTLRAGRSRGDAGEFRVVPSRRPPPHVAQPAQTAQPPRGRRYGQHGERAMVTGFGPRQGPAGTSVTIRGQRLASDLELRFGDRVLAPSRATPTAITFTVPRRAQTASIVLRGPRGQDIVVGTFEVSSGRAAAPAVRQAEVRRAAEARWNERQARLAATEAARLEALRQEEEALRQSREQRRQERAAQLRAQWEQRFLAEAAVRDELALHAERMAQLSRMLRLAEAQKDSAMVVRIDVLTRREEERHRLRMEDLRSALSRG